MRNFIVKLILFFSFMVVAYVSLLYIWQNTLPSYLKPNLKYSRGSYGHMYTRLNDVHFHKDIDILFLGSSHTYRGFDNRIFCQHGYISFNLGSSAQTPFQTSLLLNRYLDHLNPKLVIYEIYPKTFELDGVESSIDILSNGKNDLSSIIMAYKVKNIKPLNTLLFSLIYKILNTNNKYHEPFKKGEDLYIEGGFVEKNIRYYNSKESFKDKKWNINNDQLIEFKKNLTLLEQKDIKVILVYAPITQKLYNSYINNDSIENQFKNLGLEYYNFNKILSLNDSLHFYDDDHLNQKGVKIFNTKLIKILSKKYKNQSSGCTNLTKPLKN